MKSHLRSETEVKAFVKSKKKIRSRAQLKSYSDRKMLKDIIDPNLNLKDVIERSFRSGKAYGRINERNSQSCEDPKCISCVQSCAYLKTSSLLNQTLSQFFYLSLCAEGCRQEFSCFIERYCLPVMPENPEYFIVCANSCSVFPIMPLFFITSD